MILSDLFYWKAKTPLDNDWRPRPGYDKAAVILPPSLSGVDVPAAIVDVAPFICGAGGVAHLSQLNNLGWTVPASIFRNARTMGAMNRTAVLLPAVVIFCQATGLEYRNFIPRWSHDRERRRDETEVREHIQVGFGIGLGVWFTRVFLLRMGRAYPGPLLEATMGGALADLMDREYRKAHGL